MRGSPSRGQHGAGVNEADAAHAGVALESEAPVLDAGDHAADRFGSPSTYAEALGGRAVDGAGEDLPAGGAASVSDSTEHRSSADAGAADQAAPPRPEADRFNCGRRLAVEWCAAGLASERTTPLSTAAGGGGVRVSGGVASYSHGLGLQLSDRLGPDPITVE